MSTHVSLLTSIAGETGLPSPTPTLSSTENAHTGTTPLSGSLGLYLLMCLLVFLLVSAVALVLWRIQLHRLPRSTPLLPRNSGEPRMTTAGNIAVLSLPTIQYDYPVQSSESSSVNVTPGTARKGMGRMPFNALRIRTPIQRLKLFRTERRTDASAHPANVSSPTPPFFSWARGVNRDGRYGHVAGAEDGNVNISGSVPTIIISRCSPVVSDHRTSAWGRISPVVSPDTEDSSDTFGRASRTEILKSVESLSSVLAQETAHQPATIGPGLGLASPSRAPTVSSVSADTADTNIEVVSDLDDISPPNSPPSPVLLGGAPLARTLTNQPHGSPLPSPASPSSAQGTPLSAHGAQTPASHALCDAQLNLSSAQATSPKKDAKGNGRKKPFLHRKSRVENKENVQVAVDVFSASPAEQALGFAFGASAR